MTAKIDIDEHALAEFCERNRIRRFSLFGSVLRDDFTSDSDVDVLVEFEPDAQWSLLDLVRMEQDLSGMLGRRVDLVSRRAIERSRNWIRRDAILHSAEQIYASR